MSVRILAPVIAVLVVSCGATSTEQPVVTSQVDAPQPVAVTVTSHINPQAESSEADSTAPPATYRLLRVSHEPDPCELIDALMSDLVSIQTNTRNQLERIDDGYFEWTGIGDDLSYWLMRNAVEDALDAHYKYLWVWEWLDRDCGSVRASGRLAVMSRQDTEIRALCARIRADHFNCRAPFAQIEDSTRGLGNTSEASRQSPLVVGNAREPLAGLLQE